MAKRDPRGNTLICIPCYNCEQTIEAVLQPLLADGDADILLVDDQSGACLETFLRERFAEWPEQVTVVRPARKVYCGGAKNLGVEKALDDGYQTVIMVDSDIIAPAGFAQSLRDYFRSHPEAVVVAPTILPYGTPSQYSDTLINFSAYLPDPGREVSYRRILAGYAYALNMPVFRRQLCFNRIRIGGEDVIFFRGLSAAFGVEGFPLLNRLAVEHRPPRGTWQRALAAQQRYGRAFFTHSGGRREFLFDKVPPLHLLTPRWWLLLLRLLRRRRFRDLAYLPRCWRLDMARALQILRLRLAGYTDPVIDQLDRHDHATTGQQAEEVAPERVSSLEAMTSGKV
jgi:glycosyltransferase involved in cell wall biosynthesis